MHRNQQSFPIQNVQVLKQQVLAWLRQFKEFAFLDSNDYYQRKQSPHHLHETQFNKRLQGKASLPQPPFLHYHRYDWLIGAGCRKKAMLPQGQTFQALQQFLDAQQDWVMGHFGYHLNKETEGTKDANQQTVAFRDAHFFVPEHLLELRGSTLTIHTFAEPETVYQEIRQCILKCGTPTIAQLHPRVRREEYLEVVQRIREHIREGDVYEMNYCVEFFAEEAHLDPFILYLELTGVSPTPFAAFYRLNEQFLLCSSMERFLMKQQQTLVSQPIKGTIRRGKDEAEDLEMQEHLLCDEKERAENVMIVDLVRNDLARSCRPGSVRVEELFGIYQFPQVHQMISSVCGELRDEVQPVEAIRAAFPMGSMTGAPKIMAMELIEELEATRRSLYSGAVGYFTPDQNFDFNVVIRSLLYDQQRKYLSVPVGSAITWDSVPEQEWEELLVKISGIRQLLSS